MKKLFAILFAVCCISSASAVSYKGYVDTSTGLVVSTDEDLCSLWGVSTSHGIQIIDGLFVGAGLELALASEIDDYEDVYFLGAMFSEARYNFLRKKKVSPFVGLRLGAGYDAICEDFAFYTCPLMAGCTFNFTKKFGLDVGLQWNVYTCDAGDDQSHSIAIKLGIHF